MLKRLLNFDIALQDSFFLFGPRQTGKSTLLKASFPDATFIDLLQSDVFSRYASAPHLLREELLAQKSPPTRVIIDEIQLVPQLLNEVHHLIENHKIRFGLCGSSARKLRHGYSNMLGGRALRFELTGLIAKECPDFDLTQMLNVGYLPRHYLNPDRFPLYVRSYVGDYLKEEIAAEGLVRNLPVFSEFLIKAALSDTEPLNFSTFARDVGVSSATIKEYFHILEDTFLGHFVPAWSRRIKRRITAQPKFYFDDVGIVNHLAKRGSLLPGSELFGKAFENWVFHELHAWRRYGYRDMDISYWRLSSGQEVDFILSDMQVAIEAKAVQKIHSDHLRGVRELQKEVGARPLQRIIVCLESKRRFTEDGILILPYRDFIEDLWDGSLFSQ